MHVDVQFPVILPIIHRHVDDAVFYWSQLDSASASPQIDVDRLVHFNVLLDPHLDGSRVAGSTAWPAALAALQRW